MSVAQDRDLTLADIIEYNMARPFEQRKALLYGEGPTFQVKTLFDELPSFLVGGLPNFGKTSAVAFLACQMVMCGAQLVVIDPHMFAPRDSLSKIIAPLAPWYALPPIDFEDTHSVVGAFQFVLNEYERRNRKNAKSGEPLFLICDEWNLLLDMLDDDELETVILAVRTIARSARKFGIWLCLIAQNWNLDSSGGPEVRKSITGRISFAQELSDMRMTLNTRDTRSLSDLTSAPLGKGQAIFKHPSYGMKRVWFPPMDRRECEIVAHTMKAYSEKTPESESEYSEFAMPEMPELPLLPDKRSHSEQNSGLKAPATPIGSMEIMSNANLNNENITLNIQSLNLNNENIKITESEYKHIIGEATKQLRETGKVNRTRIKENLGGNSHLYRKIKAVCDFMGWDNKMQKKELSTQEKQEMRSIAGKCAKCGATDNLEIDHIWPQSLGGSNEPDNLQVLCRSCNARKGIGRHR